MVVEDGTSEVVTWEMVNAKLPELGSLFESPPYEAVIVTVPG
jgi:hypothetical protein